MAYFTITGQRKNSVTGKPVLGNMGMRRLWHTLFPGFRDNVDGGDATKDSDPDSSYNRSTGAVVRSTPSDEIRILYTGDLGRNGKAIVRDPAVNFPAPDYIFMESTYGNRLHEEQKVAMDAGERL